MMALGFYLDILVAVLLVATLIFCWILNQKLGIIRNHRAELEALIAAFNDSCLRAEAGAKALRSATDEATRLQQYLERSQNLRDDLSYLVDRGGSLADRLEGGVRTARHEVGRPGTKPQSRDNVSPLPVRPDKLADSASTTPPMGGETTQGPSASRSIRPTRDRASLRQALAGSEGSNESGEGVPPRSRAERELLQALRARR